MTLPQGPLALLFTDIEGSTALWEAHGASMAASLAQHDQLVRGLIEEAGGHVFTTAGDSFAAAFADCGDALAVARAIQRQLADADWEGPPLRVRIGLHVGVAHRRDGDFFGVPPAVAARVEAAGHGGQILATADFVAEAPASDALLIGRFPLRGVDGEVEIHQIGGRADDFPPLRLTAPGRIALPATAGTLYGRDDLLSQVSGAVKVRRLVTLTGAGGSGKTRLAIAAAEATAGVFNDGVTFVDLARIETNDPLVPTTVLDDLGESASSTEGALARLTVLLSTQHRLVVLDNCEHVIDGVAALVEQVLSVPGPGVVLATSRERLDLPQEQVIRVDPLDASGVDSPAAQLFRDRVTSQGIPLADDEATADTVRQLVAELDGIPLAIELAATRAAIMDPAQLLDSVGRRFEVLRARSRRRHRGPDRHATLRATVDWSHSLLDGDEQAVFEACGVMLGAFDLPMIAATTPRPTADAAELVESLIDKSMLIPLDHPSGRRFRMLDTIRAYAVERLGEHGEEVATRTRLARFLAERYRWDGDGGDLLADADNIRSAVGHALAHHAEDPTLCVQLVAADWYLALDHVAQRTVAPPDVVERLLGNVESPDAFRLACNVTADGRPRADRLIEPFTHARTTCIRNMAVVVRFGLRYFSAEPLPSPGLTLDDAASWTDDSALSLFSRLVVVRSPDWDLAEVLPAALDLAADFAAANRTAHAAQLIGRIGLVEAITGVSRQARGTHAGTRAIMALRVDDDPAEAVEQLTAMRTRCLAAPRAHAVVETLLTAAGLANALGRDELAREAVVCCGAALGFMPLDGWLARQLDAEDALRAQGATDGPWARMDRFEAILDEVERELRGPRTAP